MCQALVRIWFILEAADGHINFFSRPAPEQKQIPPADPIEKVYVHKSLCAFFGPHWGGSPRRMRTPHVEYPQGVTPGGSPLGGSPEGIVKSGR